MNAVIRRTFLGVLALGLILAHASAVAGTLYKLVPASGIKTKITNYRLLINDHGQIPTFDSTSKTFGYWQDGVHYNLGSRGDGYVYNITSINNGITTMKFLANGPGGDPISPLLVAKTGAFTQIAPNTLAFGYGLNNSGKVVGAVVDDYGLSEAAYYNGTTFTPLGQPDNAESSEGTDINGQGNFVVNSISDSGTTYNAFLCFGTGYAGKVAITDPFTDASDIWALDINDRHSILCQATSGVPGYFRYDYNVTNGTYTYLPLRNSYVYLTTTTVNTATLTPVSLNNDNIMAGNIYIAGSACQEAGVWGADGSGYLLRQQAISMGSFTRLVHGKCTNINGDVVGYGDIPGTTNCPFIAYLVYRFPNLFTPELGTASGVSRDNVRTAGDGKVMTLTSTPGSDNYHNAAYQFDYYGIPATQVPYININFTIKSSMATGCVVGVYNNQTSNWDYFDEFSLVANQYQNWSPQIQNETYQVGDQTRYKYIDPNGKLRVRVQTYSTGASHTLTLDQVGITLF